MNPKTIRRIAAGAGFLAVALGAFGAHTLSALLARLDTTHIWEKAVLYHFIHALMLFVLADREPLRRGPWFCFLIGILVFSGSLYVMAVTNLRWLGAITPIGGVSFLAGWAWLARSPAPGESR
jgi:uncharacterized membrane protein YgdD (TMEM256/DUF423 family)